MTRSYVCPPQRGRAVYLYAGQDRNHRFVGRDLSAIRPGGAPPWLGGTADLDFLDASNPLWHVDRALFSMGQYLGSTVPPGMFGPRPGVTILGDSGGYQLLEHPKLWQGDTTRRWVLTAQEHHTDEAMTLDIPSRGVAPGTPWPTFRAALDITDENLRYFDRLRIGRTRFLNVLQGEDRRQANQWYDRVKWFPAGGWAFGGGMRLDMAHLASMLCRIADEGLLGPDRNRIHVLGRADLRLAVLLSALQRGIQRRVDDDGLLITFDAASPSIHTKNRHALGLPWFGPSNFKISVFQPQRVTRPGFEQARFPAGHTAVGSRLRMGELCQVKPGSMARTAWDELSEEMMVNHNVEATLWAIDAANRIMELDRRDALELAPNWLVGTYHAVIEACSRPDPLSYLKPHGAGLRDLDKELSD